MFLHVTTSPETASDGRSAGYVIALFLITRIAIVAVFLAAVVFLEKAGCPDCPGISESRFLSALANWDGEAYVAIASRGYAQVNSTYAAYFPLYPALMRVVGTLGGGGTDALIVAGALLSNAACLAASLLLVRVASGVRRGSPVVAAANLLTFPSTVFLSTVYADSLFIALALAAALTARRSRWWSSGTFAALAALTRPFGGLAVVPMAILMWRARSSIDSRSWPSLLLAPAAFIAWVAYLYSITGDPLAVAHGYVSGFAPRTPLQSVTDLFDPSVYGFPWIVGASFALFCLLAIVCWRVTGAWLAAYATLMMILMIAAGSLTSSLRYELSVYPAFIVMPVVFGSPLTRVAWNAVSFSLALVLTGMFALYFWVG